MKTPLKVIFKRPRNQEPGMRTFHKALSLRTHPGKGAVIVQRGKGGKYEDSAKSFYYVES